MTSEVIQTNAEVVQSVSSEAARPEKHVIVEHVENDGDVQSTKRIKISNHTDQQGSNSVSESDVGIIAYVNPNLEPIEGGIIKQRYSDFHVREVARGGSVCRINSLLPPTEEEGGEGKVYALVKALQAEQNDRTGQLKRERLAKEEQERKVIREARQEQQKQEALQRNWDWRISDEQNAKLLTFLDSDGVEALKTLYTQGPKSKKEGKDDRQVHTLPLSDKQQRTEVHQLIRELCKGFLVTETVETQKTEGNGNAVSIRIRWGSGNPADHRRMSKEESKLKPSDIEEHSAPFIHFHLHKTNRDSQDALNILARSLGLLNGGGGGGRGGGRFGKQSSNQAVKEITVAGTKDKRAITIQQVCLKRGRKTLDDVWRMANGIRRNFETGSERELMDAITKRGDRGIRISQLRYADSQLHLGELEGNEFEIVLRNLKVNDRKIVDSAIEVLKTKGFINYYGMQRFGTSSISTHKVGIALLKNDYKTAVQLIMSPRQGDAENVQEARMSFQNGDLDNSLSLFPHFNVPERSIIQRMRSDRYAFPEGQDPFSLVGIDWKKYFSALPRTLRTMYVHAYQSYVWNSIATERVHRFGLADVMIGDLVVCEGTNVGAQSDGEQISSDSNEGFPKKKVKMVEDASDASRYTIHDVMIPLPGSEVRIPAESWMLELYEEILSRDGLKVEDLQEAGKQSPELALTGDYRALLHLPRNVSYELVTYTDPNVNLVQSDEDKILGLEKPPTPTPFVERSGSEENSFVALIIRFTLGVSSYATMALREILKQETSVSHQKELTMRGEDKKVE